MSKQRKLVIVKIGFIIILTFFIYWFYFSKPGPFLKNNDILLEMNRTYPEVSAKTVQDTIFLDKKHVFVPFISERDRYGLSYWIWKNHKWKVAYIENAGQPKIWKISKKDLKTHYFIWNIHPEDQLKTLRFFLIRNRGFHGTNDSYSYLPRVQMENSVSIKQKPYGVMKMPKDWVSFMSPFIKVESAKLPESIFQTFILEQHMYIGWIPYDQSGKETFPEKSVNGNGYSMEDIVIDHVMILNEVDLK
jgi:hypothetical protein